MYILRTDNVKARKVYICGLCGKKIVIGEKYFSQVSVDTGRFYTFRKHSKCGFIATKLDMYADCQQHSIGGFDYLI